MSCGRNAPAANSLVRLLAHERRVGRAWTGSGACKVSVVRPELEGADEAAARSVQWLSPNAPAAASPGPYRIIRRRGPLIANCARRCRWSSTMTTTMLNRLIGHNATKIPNDPPGGYQFASTPTPGGMGLAAPPGPSGATATSISFTNLSFLNANSNGLDKGVDGSDNSIGLPAAHLDAPI